MSKKDKVQAELTWHQLLFTILIGVDFSIIGWFVTSYENIEPIIGIFSIVIVILIAIIVLYMRSLIKYNINEMEEL